ncbi:MAG: rRNA maturation RNase YbeY [Clostridia bacterium]|nr:rRNA maturation RNase YbeY [Clostridia bacterium]
MLKIYCEDYDFTSLAAAFEGIAKGDPMCCDVILTDEDYIRELNREERSVDAVTDVLSFPSFDGIRGKELKKEDCPYDIDEEGQIIIGSIAVCRKRCEEQAEEYGHSFERELNYLVTHGVLHLLGYDHMTDEDKAEMRALEEQVLAKIGLSRD